MEISDEARVLGEVARTLKSEAGAKAALLPSLLFLTDGPRTPEPWRVAALLPPDAAVIYRGYGGDDDAEEASRLRAVTAGRGTMLLVSHDIGLARSIGADGVHLPEAWRGRAAEYRHLWSEALITATAHDPSDLQGIEGADACILSPIFAAGGGSSLKSPLGVGALNSAGASGRCVYALGGVDARTAPMLVGSGACGIAAVGSLVRAFADGIRT